ncbi:MAG: lipoyl domain-containing protein [Rhodobacter sp.]|nr:lipoyl domain-containing protein [Rhodobacter sp.]MCY4168456.1 lipoyl domain-containing protein [Rhodobacter sp.]MCY4243463.1 lipoyl domain-containing protein [Rhodobacter sp.]
MARVELKMPELGNEITEAQIDALLKEVGDRVSEGEEIITITTPKVTMDLEAPASGTVVEVFVEEDEIVAVGAVLAVIEA